MSECNRDTGVVMSTSICGIGRIRIWDWLKGKWDVGLRASPASSHQQGRCSPTGGDRRKLGVSLGSARTADNQLHATMNCSAPQRWEWYRQPQYQHSTSFISCTGRRLTYHPRSQEVVKELWTQWLINYHNSSWLHDCSSANFLFKSVYDIDIEIAIELRHIISGRSYCQRIWLLRPN